MILLSFLFQSQGQDKKWTLQECIDYGVDRNLSMERQLLNNKTDNKNLRDARLDLLPSVDGSSSWNYNFGRSIGADNTYINTRNITNYYRVGASLNLFSGFRAINTLRYRKVSQMKGLEDSEKKANDIAISIMQAFYDLAYAEGLIEISTEQLENARSATKTDGTATRARDETEKRFIRYTGTGCRKRIQPDCQPKPQSHGLGDLKTSHELRGRKRRLTGH